MDAGNTHISDSWLLRLAEQATRTCVVVLVLTGQMLPAGSAAAQDDPPAPGLKSPADAAAAGTAKQPPEPPKSESVAPPSAEGKSQPETAPPPESPATAPAPIDALPEPLPVVIPEDHPGNPTPVDSHGNLGDWKITIRAGLAPARPAPFIQAPLREPGVSAPVAVPVTVIVNNSPAQFPLMWYGPATYPSWWYNAPTSAYLFQRPRQYWQMRQDFYHLRPFIPGLAPWY